MHDKSGVLSAGHSARHLVEAWLRYARAFTDVLCVSLPYASEPRDSGIRPRSPRELFAREQYPLLASHPHQLCCYILSSSHEVKFVYRDIKLLKVLDVVLAMRRLSASS